MTTELPHDYAWAAECGGVLDRAQRRAAAAAIRAGYLELARSAVGSLVRRRPASGGIPGTPDSVLAREALQAAREQSPDLLGHGVRTWIFGDAFAAAAGARVDRELLYATALLHDSGLMSEVLGEDFTVRSAEALIEVARRAEAPEEVGVRMADAAVAHASPGLRPVHNDIGYYVQIGALADLAGLRAWDLPRGLARQAYQAHPAAGVHASIPRMIAREAKQVPEGRWALLHRYGLGRVIAVSPMRWMPGR